MKKLSIQNVKKMSKLEMKSITAGSDSGGGGGGGGGGGTPPPPTDCFHTCWSPGYNGQCINTCTYCWVPAGATSGVCQP
jgi:hypothetical protein